MSINSIGGGSGFNGSAGVSRTKADSEAPGAAGASGKGQKLSDMLSKLQQLSQQNPAQFAKVTSDLASQFRDAAKSASAPDGARLNKLADGLEQASKSGNLSSLQQPKKGGHHHHAKPPADAASATAPNPNAQPDTSSSSVVSKAIDEIDKALAAATTTPATTK
jgi:hypothetical protein